jgi:hypothetical protein
MIPDLHQLLHSLLQQQEVNADEAPALLRDLAQSLGIRYRDRYDWSKGKLLLDNHRGTPHL